MFGNIQWQEEQDFTHTSAAEWDRAEARERGADQPEAAWILSDRDVWYPNPAYRGPRQPHPESYEAEMAERGVELEPLTDEERLNEELSFRESYPTDDDIPF